MPKRREMRPKKGDLFQFEIGNGQIAYGQIVIASDRLYVVIYDQIHPNHWEFKYEIIGFVCLCGWTLDARLHHGMWKIVGNFPLPCCINFPEYKVRYDGRMAVETFDGQFLRYANEEDEKKLAPKSVISPIIFEDALESIHGLRPWNDMYGRMLVCSSRKPNSGDMA